MVEKGTLSWCRCWWYTQTHERTRTHAQERMRRHARAGMHSKESNTGQEDLQVYTLLLDLKYLFITQGHNFIHIHPHLSSCPASSLAHIYMSSLIPHPLSFVLCSPSSGWNPHVLSPYSKALSVTKVFFINTSIPSSLVKVSLVAEHSVWAGK